MASLALVVGVGVARSIEPLAQSDVGFIEEVGLADGDIVEFGVIAKAPAVQMLQRSSEAGLQG